MQYEVRITMVQIVTVPVEADNMIQAKTIAERSWKNDEYAHSDTHSRLRRESVTFETLYPDSRTFSMSGSNMIDLSNRKVSERER